MMICDAHWLQKTLAKFEVEELSPLLNLGSSTLHFRTVEQPYVHDMVFAPLEQRGVNVIHTDLKTAPGVDISADILDPRDHAKLKAVSPKAVICTHMFEHVADRDLMAERIMELLPPGGLFFVTVPFSYHEHRDPIDTLYRPSPDELTQLFPGQVVLEKAELIGHTYWTQVRKRPFTLFFRHFTRFFLPFLGLDKWKRSMTKLYWLFHPYKVSAIIGRKVA